MPSVKRILQSIVPPLLWSIGSAVKRRTMRSTTLLEYAPKGWATALPDDSASNDFWRADLDRQQASCQALIARAHSSAPLLSLDDDENLKHALFGYVLALATRQRSKLSVLDYGGSLGDYYWLGRALVPEVELDYHCKELATVTAAGRLLTPNVTWHTDDACLADAYDLVMFSSSIQYLSDWQNILQRAAKSARTYLFLSDVPTVQHVPPYVATQRSRGHAHFHRQLNRSEVISTVEATGLRLVREFAMGAHPPIISAPEQPTCLGWLFMRG